MPLPLAEIRPAAPSRAVPGHFARPIAGLVAAAVLQLGAAATPAAPGPAAAHPVDRGDAEVLSDPGSAWARRDGWRRPPPAAEPGAYVEAIDVSAAPDGSLWLLDGRGAALHQRRPHGLWTRLIPLPRAWSPRRLSAGADLWLLGSSGGAAQLLRQAPGGGSATVLDLGVPAGAGGPVDLAALPEGGLALALAQPPAVELRDAQGRLAQRIDLAALFLPDCARPLPVALAPGQGGQLWLGLRRDESACPGGPDPDPADPRPALVEGLVRIAGGSQPQVLAVEPGQAPLDLAGQGAGLWRLDAEGPVEVGVGGAPPLPSPRGWQPRALALLAEGRPAVVSQGCPGGQVFSQGPDGSLEPVGRLLRPLGSAPGLPLRLAAFERRVWSLEGQAESGGGAIDGGAAAFLGWGDEGRLLESHPLCEASPAEGDPADLLAFDGAPLRLLPTGFARVFAGQPVLPSPVLEGAWWGAAAAAGGRLALLDLAGPRVLALDGAGRSLGEWKPGGLPSDLALLGRYAYLSDPLARRIEVRDLLSGRVLHSFRSHLPLWRLEAEPDGSGLLGLASGDWALRYSLDGRLTAAWPLAQAPGTVHTDLLPLGGGRGAVAARLRLSPPGADGDWSQALPVDAALDPYVALDPEVAFGPGATVPEPLTAGEACVVHAAKRAWPPSLLLGQAVDVELRLDGRCLSSAKEGRLLLLLDPASGPAGQASLAALLPHLDDQRLSLGLVTLQADQVLELPPPSGAALVRSLGLRPDLGGRRLAAALARAVDRLAGTSGGTARLLLLLGRPPASDQLAALRTELERARRAGIAITALFHGRPALDAADRAAWAPLFAAGEAQGSPRPYQLPLLAPLLAPASRDPAFRRLTVVDRLPAGLAPEPGSVEPPGAVWDAAGGSLTWRLEGLDRDEVLLRYRLLPLAPGRQAAGGAGATADYLDGFGYAGRLPLPLPFVQVALPRPIHLPYLARGHCPQRRPPLDLLLVLDLSSSMAQGAADGRSKLAAAVDAALGLAGYLDWQRDRVALIGFSAAGQVLSPLSGDDAALRAALAGLTTGEGTRIDLGLGAARQAWEAAPRPGARAVLILLTDGRQDGGQEPAALAQAAALRAAGVVPYTVGLGPDHDAALLSAIAGSPDRYLASPDPSTLAERFGAIFARESCGEQAW